MINRYLTAVSDADLLDAASDALVDAGWSLDEDRELPFEAGYYEDPSGTGSRPTPSAGSGTGSPTKSGWSFGCTTARGRTPTTPSTPRRSGSGWRPP